jgi:hypothetical protein
MMRENRRAVLRISGVLVAGFGGCLDAARGPNTSGGTSTEDPDERDPSTDRHGVTDVWVDNETDDRRSVSLTATTGGDAVLEVQLELSPEGTDGDTVTFEDPFADETAYELVVESPGLATADYEWDGEFDDNEGVRILVNPTGIEFQGVQH